MIDVLGPEKRRRRSVQEKIAIVQQSFEPGMTVSLVARQHGVAASQLFRHCCKVSDEAAFCLIQRPYISKTLLTRRISPRGSP